MSKSRKLRAVTLIRQADTEKKRETLFMAKRRILRQIFKEGLITEAESQENYIALDVILRLIKDPTTRPELRFLCAKELWPHEAMTLAEKSRLDAMDAAGGPPNITVVVQSWAANKAPAAALPEPAETIIEPDAPHNNNTPPSRPLNPDTRERERMAARAAREAEGIETHHHLPEKSADDIMSDAKREDAARNEYHARRK